MNICQVIYYNAEIDVSKFSTNSSSLFLPQIIALRAIVKLITNAFFLMNHEGLQINFNIFRFFL